MAVSPSPGLPAQSAARCVLFAVLVLLLPGRACAQAIAGTQKAGFYSERTVLWQNRPQIIPVRLPEASAADEEFTAASADESAVEVLRAPTILAGETTGYLRVRGLKPGRTTLTLRPGGAAIAVEVKPDPAAAVIAGIDPDLSLPRIVSPMPDAAVWGKFAVGVEAADCPIRAQDQDLFHAHDPAGPAPAATGARILLRLPDGRLLEPSSQTAPEAGPVRRYAFTVPAADLPAGPLRLTAVSVPQGGTDFDRRFGRGPAACESEPLVLRNLRETPAGAESWSGECETVNATTRDANAPGRPSRYGVKQPKAGPDAAASGGQSLQAYSSDPAWCLPVVVQHPGDYQMFFQARGELGGGAFPTLSLYLNDNQRPVGLVRLASDKYQRTPIGKPVPLGAGPQVLTVRFSNDFNAGKDDRNAWFDRFELVRVGDSAPPPPRPSGKAPPAAPLRAALAPLIDPAASLPRLNVLYPANGAPAFGVDAVVARASGAVPLAWADVLLDGQPLGVRCEKPAADEPLVFPLLLRGLAAGTHRLAVQGADAAGRKVESPAQLIAVLAQAPAVPGRYERALRLLDRLAFGPEPRELAAILASGEAPWLDARLQAGFDAPDEQALLAAAKARYPGLDDNGNTASRALMQWMAGSNPVRSRFTAWVENHFSTWMNKTGPEPKWIEHYNFCALGIAPFADLLSASAHSPAMLAYLDQEKSYAAKLNENYAREIMELHTLGVHGGYRQTDVTALAGLLTGWTLAEEAGLPNRGTTLLVERRDNGDVGVAKSFRYAPSLNDGKERRVFGMRFGDADGAGRYDRVRLAMELLASHPSTAEHICRKLAEHYVGVPAPDALVRDAARVFRESGGDMRAVVRAVAGHPGFWQAPAKLATPFDFSLRLARLCGAEGSQAPKPEQVEAFLKRSGMGLFDRVTPDGYPENGAAYADSNALLQRWRFVQSIGDSLNRLVPASWRGAPAATATPPAAEGAADCPPAADPAQRFVDLCAVRLTGRLLSVQSNQAAREVLGDSLTPEHLRQTLVFVGALPEVNLR